MRNKSLKYIFGILLSSVLLTVGCGSSSSNNPVSNSSANSGLVSVSGNVKNSDGKGTVSFYTPTAISESNMTNSISRAVVNNEVYTFNIDENGNYAGQIPAGDYYLIAQNSDGSMKYASERLNISMDSTVSEEVEGSTDAISELLDDIKLVPTINITGTLYTTSELVKDQYVYIENMPFVAKTDGTGVFTLTSVPAKDSYKICSNIWVGETRYQFYFPMDAEYISKYKDETTKTIPGVNLRNFDPIALNGTKLGKVAIKFTPLPSGKSIINVGALTDNKAYPAFPDYSSTTDDKPNTYVLPISSNSEVNKILIQTVDSSNNVENNLFEVEESEQEDSNSIEVNIFAN